MSEMMKAGVLALVVSSVVSISTVAIDRLFIHGKPEVLTVDLQDIVAEEIQKNTSPGLSDEQRRVRADRFSKALEVALTEAGEEGKKIVMVAPAVLRGSTDITSQVRESIEADLKAGISK